MLSKLLDTLFSFPIVMIDGDNEEKKQESKLKFGEMLNSEEEEEPYDIVYGEAEYPYYEFIGAEDRWLPTAESLEKALLGKFDACIVRFNNIGQFLVPMSRKKFKAMISKFGQEYELTLPPQYKEESIKILSLNAEQAKKIMSDGE